MKWDMGWMNDTLRYLRHEAVHRSYHQNELSFRMVYAFTENFILPLSHDEVVHGKRSLLSQMPGDYWQQFANLRLLYGYQYTMPGKKLLFMGGELGQWTEWNHDAQLDWALLGHKYHDALRLFVGDLNRIYRSEPALYEVDFKPEGFRWIQADDYQNSVYAYYRIGKDPREIVLVVANFTPVPRKAYRVGVPRRLLPRADQQRRSPLRWRKRRQCGGCLHGSPSLPRPRAEPLADRASTWHVDAQAGLNRASLSAPVRLATTRCGRHFCLPVLFCIAQIRAIADPIAAPGRHKYLLRLGKRRALIVPNWNESCGRSRVILQNERRRLAA